MQNDKLTGLISIAKKGGRLLTGEETVRALAREKRARLVLLASDAGDSTVRRIQAAVEGTRQPVVRVPLDKIALGHAAGRDSCAAAAFTDVALALAFAEALPPGTAEPEVLEDLRARTLRVRQRAKARRQSKNGKT